MAILLPGSMIGNEFIASIEEVERQISEHSKRSSELVTLTRDLSLSGAQVITTQIAKPIRTILASGAVIGSKKFAFGMYSSYNKLNRTVCTLPSSGNYSINSVFLSFYDLDVNNRTQCTVSSVDIGSFRLNWTKDGTGCTGTAAIFMTVFYG